VRHLHHSFAVLLVITAVDLKPARASKKKGAVEHQLQINSPCKDMSRVVQRNVTWPSVPSGLAGWPHHCRVWCNADDTTRNQLPINSFSTPQSTPNQLQINSCRSEELTVTEGVAIVSYRSSSRSAARTPPAEADERHAASAVPGYGWGFMLRFRLSAVSAVPGYGWGYVAASVFYSHFGRKRGSKQQNIRQHLGYLVFCPTWLCDVH